MGCELTKTITCTAVTIDLYFPTEWQWKRKYSMTKTLSAQKEDRKQLF
jgi:hypothetical protein